MISNELDNAVNNDRFIYLLQQYIKIQEYKNNNNSKKSSKNNIKVKQENKNLNNLSNISYKKESLKDTRIIIDDISSDESDTTFEADSIDDVRNLTFAPPPLKKQKLNNKSKYIIKSSDESEDDEFEEDNMDIDLLEPVFDSSLYTNTNNVLYRCAKRRARPTGRSFTEDQISYEYKNTSLIDYSNHGLLDKEQQIKEISMIQRIIIELDLSLRLSTNTYPNSNPYEIKTFIKDSPSKFGDRRPFLSIQGLLKYQNTDIIPGLIRGDIIHAPFTPEEELLMIRYISKDLLVFIDSNNYIIDKIKKLDQFYNILYTVSNYLSGRKVDDCVRWLQSFLNKRYYKKNNKSMTQKQQQLYDYQNELHIYNPRSPLLITSNPLKLRQEPLIKQLIQREITSLGSRKYQETLLSRSRYKNFTFYQSIKGSTSEIIDSKLDPTGYKQIAICSTKIPNELLLYDIKKEKYSYLEGHSNTVSRIGFAQDGEYLISTSFDKTIKIWDTYTKNLLHTFENRVINIENEDGDNIQQQFVGHKSSIISLAQGKENNSHLFLTSDSSRGLFLWNINTFENMEDLSYTEDIEDSKWPGDILELEFIGNNNNLVVAGTDNPTLYRPGIVQIWDIQEGKLLQTYNHCKKYVSCLSVSPDRNLVFCGSADKNCYLYDIRSNGLLHIFKTLLKGSLDVNTVSFSPCQRFITCSSEDNRSLIFDSRNYKLIHVLPHNRPETYIRPQGVTSIKWLGNTNTLLTGGEDGVNMWNLDYPYPLIKSYKYHTAPVSSLDCSNNYFVSGADDSIVNVYSDNTPSSILC